MRENSGVLERNKKRENDRQPEFKGHCSVDGKEFWISAWVKESQYGKFFSMAFEPKDRQQSAGEESQVDSSEVPF
jgi:hypothetical protein